MIKFILTTVAAMFFATAAYTFAKADECENGTMTEMAAVLKDNGVQTTVLSDGDTARIIEKKGPPPNGAEGTPYTSVLAVKDDIGAIFFFQGECFINRIGPAPLFLIQSLFGQVSADRPYLQSMLVLKANHAAS